MLMLCTCWCQNPNQLVSDSISDPCISIKFVWWEVAGWSPRIFFDYEQNIHEHIIFKLTINKYLKLQRIVRGAGSFSGVNPPTLKSVMGFTGKTNMPFLIWLDKHCFKTKSFLNNLQKSKIEYSDRISPWDPEKKSPPPRGFLGVFIKHPTPTTLDRDNNHWLIRFVPWFFGGALWWFILTESLFLVITWPRWSAQV